MGSKPLKVLEFGRLHGESISDLSCLVTKYQFMKTAYDAKFINRLLDIINVRCDIPMQCKSAVVYMKDTKFICVWGSRVFYIDDDIYAVYALGSCFKIDRELKFSFNISGMLLISEGWRNSWDVDFKIELSKISFSKSYPNYYKEIKRNRRV